MSRKMKYRRSWNARNSKNVRGTENYITKRAYNNEIKNTYI